MKKRHPLHNYVAALLAKRNQPVKLTKEELDYARAKNFSMVMGKGYVELCLLEAPRSIMPFEQKED